MRTSLEHLKVGDTVALYRSGLGRSGTWDLLKITGETQTRWKTAAAEWRKKDGMRVGQKDSWNYSAIQEVTPELQIQIIESRRLIKHNSLWRDIREIKQPDHLSVERLEEILIELRPPVKDAGGD